MLHRKGSLIANYKIAAIFFILTLLVPILAACGKEAKTPAPTVTAAPTTVAPTATLANTPIPTATSTPGRTVVPTPTATLVATPTIAATPSATPAGPVKIGYLSSWTGPYALAGGVADKALAVVVNQVKAQGGILGRPMEVVKYDDGSQPTGAIAGVIKLTLEEKVAIIVSGEGTAQSVAAGSKAEELKMPFFTVATNPPDLTTMKYNVRGGNIVGTRSGDTVADYIINQFKPKTVAIMSDDDDQRRAETANMKNKLVAAGIKIVSEQYIPTGLTDLSPYLTRMKYSNPDVFLPNTNNNDYNLMIYRQIMELGGWGNIKRITRSGAAWPAGAEKLPGAVNMYFWAFWIPGLDDPGSKTFESGWKEVYGVLPTPNNLYHYMALWTAIKAIELAGTDADRDKIAQVARSGQLSWDGPGGRAVIGTNGEMSYSGHICRLAENGSFVLVQ